MLTFLLTIADESDHDKIIWIYDHFHDKMIRFAQYHLKKANQPNYDADAEDAVQNAFLKITKHIGSVDVASSEKELKSYIYVILKHEVNRIISDHMRSDEADTCVEAMTDVDFFAEMNIKDRYDSVVNAIRELDDKYSITLWLYYLDSRSVKEIARMMGIPDKTVYTRLERGKRILLEKLNEGEE